MCEFLFANTGANTDATAQPPHGCTPKEAGPIRTAYLLGIKKPALLERAGIGCVGTKFDLGIDEINCNTKATPLIALNVMSDDEIGSVTDAHI